MREKFLEQIQVMITYYFYPRCLSATRAILKMTMFFKQDKVQEEANHDIQSK